MKKIFLPLLALVGMGVGFMSTSCSGGGSTDKDGPAQALAGMELEAWPSTTPALGISFDYVNSAHVCSTTYYPGGNRATRGYSGIFSITETGKEGGDWVIGGIINIRDREVLDDTNFKTLCGVGTGDIQAIDTFTVYFYFPENAGKMASGKASVNITGRYKGQEDGLHEFSHTYPRGCSFNVIRGELDTEYLGSKAPTYEGMTPEFFN